MKATRRGPASGHRAGAWMGLGLGLLCSVGLPLLARAQIPALEPGGGFPDRVLTRRDWAALQPLDLADLLRHVAGFGVERRGGLGSRELLEVAGSLPGRIRILVDGVDYGEPELAWPRLAAVQVSTIERIELFRTQDPARIEIWTRTPAPRSPVSDFDLGRGDLQTRTRRVQFRTPAGPWQVGVHFEELLRGFQDFRVQRDDPAPTSLGRYDGRGVFVQLDLARTATSRLELRHQTFNGNAHGSFENDTDFESTDRVQSGVRWTRSFDRGRLALDIAHLVWDRDRQVGGRLQAVGEAHTRLAVDARRRWGNGGVLEWRVRAADRQGERSEAGVPALRLRRRQVATGVQVTIPGTLRWTGFAGVHRHERFGNTWSAALRAEREAAAWHLWAQGARGVSWPGWGEEPQPLPQARVGKSVAVGVRRQGGSSRASVQAFGKWMAGGSSAAFLFPAVGSGPDAVAGVLASWDVAPDLPHWRLGIQTHASWLPHVEGERGGVPRLRGELAAQWGRRGMFAGDLAATLHARLRLESRRRYEGGRRVGPQATLDVSLQALLLRRLVVFWSILDVFDTAPTGFPGARHPGRRNWIGAQLRLVD